MRYLLLIIWLDIHEKFNFQNNGYKNNIDEITIKILILYSLIFFDLK